MSKPTPRFKINNNEKAHGRYKGRDFTLKNDGGTLCFKFNDAAETHLVSELKSWRNLNGVEVKLGEQRENFLRFHIKNGVPILPENSYIGPEHVETDIDRVWLALQEHLLNGRPDPDAFLGELDELLKKIEEVHAGETDILDHIYNDAEDGHILAAIRETRELKERIEDWNPEATLQIEDFTSDPVIEQWSPSDPTPEDPSAE